MDVRGKWILGAGVAVLAVGAAMLLLRGRGPAEEAAEAPPPLASVAPPAVAYAPLFRGDEDPSDSAISLREYFQRFGAVAMIDPETKRVREEIAAQIREELVGKQVTWDGYVQRVEDMPSGRVMLVLGANRAQAGIEAAMVKFSPEWREELYTYQQGDAVRVVAVYDKTVSVFPSLRGKSVVAIEEEG